MVLNWPAGARSPTLIFMSVSASGCTSAGVQCPQFSEACVVLIARGSNLLEGLLRVGRVVRSQLRNSEQHAGLIRVFKTALGDALGQRRDGLVVLPIAQVSRADLYERVAVGRTLGGRLILRQLRL